MPKKILFHFLDGAREVQVGDVFYTFRRGSCREHIIEKIGRDLIHTKRDSFYIETGMLKTNYTSERAYFSKEGYERIIKETAFINKVTQGMMKTSISYEQAQKLNELLNLGVEDA